MSGDRRGRESTEKERDGEAKPQGLVLAAGGLRRCWGGGGEFLGLHILGGMRAGMVELGRDARKQRRHLGSRRGCFALWGCWYNPWMDGWMDARHPPAVQPGEGVFKAGL